MSVSYLSAETSTMKPGGKNAPFSKKITVLVPSPGDLAHLTCGGYPFLFYCSLCVSPSEFLLFSRDFPPHRRLVLHLRHLLPLSSLFLSLFRCAGSARPHPRASWAETERLAVLMLRLRATHPGAETAQDVCAFLCRR